MDIEEVKPDSLATRRNLMFASGDIPDVMFNVVSDGADLVTYGMSEGLLLPLNQYVSETLTPALYAVLNNPENADAVAAYTLPDGNMYNLPSIKGMKQIALLVGPMRPTSAAHRIACISIPSGWKPSAWRSCPRRSMNS